MRTSEDTREMCLLISRNAAFGKTEKLAMLATLLARDFDADMIRRFAEYVTFQGTIGTLPDGERR